MEDGARNFQEEQDPAVDQAVEDLAADFDRTGKPLEMASLERLAAKRNLRFSQVEAILDALAAANVPLLMEDDGEDSAPVDGARERSVEKRDGRWQSMLEHALLDARTETELGRTLRAGIAAAEQIESGEDTVRARDAVRRGEAARERLATSNLRLVWTWAAKYAAMTGLDPEDLFQDGVIGLLRAVDKFDPDVGFRFSTYAVWWIRQAVQRAVQDRGRTVRLPAWVHDQVLRLARATRLLWRETGRRPSVARLAEELAINPEQVAFLQGLASLLPVSLDETTLDGDGDPLVETVAADQDSPEAIYEAEEVARHVRDAVEALPDRKMRTIVLRRNGIGNGRPETLESIGSSLGITRERVRQIERNAMKKLMLTVPLRLGEEPIRKTEIGWAAKTESPETELREENEID
jgi:RNA polymerase sigma factor (sigma-70 family)